jgi:mycobactin peptide synthetase MbtE
MTSGRSYSVSNATLPDLIAAQVRARPSATAVRQWDERISYGELWSLAGRLAGALRAAGVGPETLVCVCADRRPASVAAFIGVQLAGAAYVPLNPADPPARHAQIAADAGTPLIVADDQTAGAVAGLGLPVLRAPADGPAGDLACPARPDNAAYVLYTSGSTGEPKGVVITHRSLASYVSAFGAFTGAGTDTRAFGFASFEFDVSVSDLFVPLAAGGELDLLGAADRADPLRLQRFCEEHSITWGNVPVALLPLLDPDRLPAWRTVITGAEAPGPEQVARWTGELGTSGRRFLNCYGATEATIDVTAFEPAGRWSRPLPIGGPLPGQRVHVVDKHLREVPDGTPGELLIGGAGLARGYLRRPGLTARQFVADPFGAEPGARLYRTGDLVIWRDGALEFLGRGDNQVKIRGRRVEIGEVETVLRGLPQVRHAIVDAVTDGGGRRLVAFCTLADGSDEAAVLAACTQVLPPALVPSAIVPLTRIPLNSSGKADLVALRAHLARSVSAPGRPPSGPVQTGVAAAWCRVLDRTEVSADDDFFGSGGHSIAAMRLVADLRSEFGRAIAIEDVFGGRTLAAIAEAVAAAPPLDDVDLVTGNPPALSPAQRRLWFLDKLAPGSAAYNIPFAERITGPLDGEALRVALSLVARRHEVLRWRISDGAGGEPEVGVRAPEPSALDVEPATEQTLTGLLDAEAAAPFDLAADPLWRARLFRLGPADHVLALTFHHAVFDGWSQRPYYDDLSQAYRAASRGGEGTLPTLPAGFSDYVAWRRQRELVRGAADLRWWLDHLAGAPLTVDLPRDSPRPAVQTYSGDMVSAVQPEKIIKAVAGLSDRLSVTAPAVYLAGFCALVHRLTGQDDLVVGTPAADRRHPDFGGLVGFFVEVLPLRVRVDPAGDFAAAVRACSDELLAALAHPAASLEALVDALGVRRHPGRQPVVQVLFNVYNYPPAQLALDGLDTRGLTPGPGGSPFDLTVYIAQRDDSHVVDIVYNTDLFFRHRAQALADCYLAFLDVLTADPSAPVGAVRLPAAWPVACADAVPDRPVRDEPSAARMSFEATGPASQAEQALASIWREVLGRQDVRLTTNFFDAGGSSLALIAVRARIAERFGRELSVAELFQYPTVRSLAGHLQGLSGAPELARAAARAASRRERARRQEPISRRGRVGPRQEDEDG